MTLRRKIVAGLLSALALATIVAVAGWQYVTYNIRRNERAPHLEMQRRPAADFPFKTLSGQPKRLSEFKGKTVFLDLWGTWCIQCVAEMPSVQKLYDHYRDDPDVVFLIVSRLDSPAKVRLYAARNGYDLPFYTMEDADIPASMQLNQFPATFLYSPDGQLAAQHVGAADWSAPAAVTFIDTLRSSR